MFADWSGGIWGVKTPNEPTDPQQKSMPQAMTGHLHQNEPELTQVKTPGSAIVFFEKNNSYLFKGLVVAL